MSESGKEESEQASSEARLLNKARVEELLKAELGELADVPPHDAFFSEMMAQPEISLAFVRHFLPKPFLELLDLETLSAIDTKFVNLQMG